MALSHFSTSVSDNCSISAHLMSRIPSLFYPFIIILVEDSTFKIFKNLQSFISQWVKKSSFYSFTFWSLLVFLFNSTYHLSILLQQSHDY